MSAEVLVVVDGEVIARHALAEYLRQCGFAVVAAASTEEAVAVLQHPEFSVTAASISLPATGLQSGFALAQWTRDQYPDIEISIAGSLDAAAEAAAEFCDQGPRLARPYDPAAIVARVRLMQERRRKNIAA